MTQPRHYRPFGALRCLLAVLVAVQHFQYLLPPESRGPFRSLGLGIVAVAVFFVISGFIVAEATATFYRTRPQAFLLNRLLRLVPPYLAALAVSLAAHQILWQCGLLQVWDFRFAGPPLDPVLIAASLSALLPFVHGGQGGAEVEFIPFVWSLRVEIAFYLTVTLAGLMLPFCVRRLGDAAAPRVLMHICFAIGFASFGVLLIVGRPLMLLDIPFFLLGVAIFRIVRHRAMDRGILVAASAAAAVWSMHGWPQPAGRNVGAQALLFLILTAAFMAATALRLSPRHAAFDRELGSLSYPLYLNHYIIGILVFDLTRLRGWAVFAFGLLLSFMLAFVMHRIVEVPLFRFRNAIRGVAL